MSIRKRIILICFLCIILCGCGHKEKIVIEVPSNTEANSIIDSARNAFEKGDFYDALNNYLEAEKVYLNLNYTSGDELAQIYSMIGRCYVQLSEYHKAKDYFEKSLAIGEKLLNNTLNFDNYYNLMKINYSIDDGDLNLAMEYGKKAEKIAIDYYGIQSRELGKVYSNMGEVYSNMEEFDNANSYMSKALKIMDHLYGQDNEDSAEIYKKLADLYVKQDQDVVAEEYLNKAVTILSKGNNENLLAVVYSDLGNIYYDKEEYGNALNCYNTCIEVYDKSKIVDYDIAKYHYWKAAALYNLKKYNDSKQEMLLAHQICESLPVKSELTEKLITVIKEALEVYYDYNYEGDKSKGFEAWYKELISIQSNQ